MTMTAFANGYAPGPGSAHYPFPGQHVGSFPYATQQAPGGYPENTSSIHRDGTQGQGEEPLVDPRDEDPPITPPPARERFSYTRYQLELLTAIFTHVRYPNSIQKQLIAKRVGITRDQVKIWFQNRRRKDVVAKQNGEEPPVDESLKGQKMVPESVVNGVISELVKFVNDPKGKKLKAKSNAKDHRKHPYSAPRPARVLTYTSPPQTAASGQCHQPTLNVSATRSLSTSPNSVHSTATSPQMCPETMAMFEALSPESIASVGQRLSEEFNTPSPNNTSPGQIIPSNEQLDMVAPPNAIAPNMSIGIVRNSHHRESESPKNGSPQAHSPTTDDGLGLSTTSPQTSSGTITVSPSSSTPQGQYGQYGYVAKPSSFSTSEYTHYQRDSIQAGVGGPNPQAFPHPMGSFPGFPVMKSEPSGYSMHQDTKPAQLNLDRVFPFPLVAEPSMVLSSIPPYTTHSNEGYPPGAFKAHPSATTAMYPHRDPYQQLLITPFNNPFYPGQETTTYDGKSYAAL